MEPNRYIYGSAAPKLPEKPFREEQPVRQTPRRNRVTVVVPEPVRYPVGKMVFCILVGFVILFTLVFRFATLTEMNGELAAMSTKLEQLKDGNRKLQAEISTSISQEHVRQVAEERLSMKMPDSYQRIPVNVPKVNYSKVTSLPKDEQKTTLSSILSSLLQ